MKSFCSCSFAPSLFSFHLLLSYFSLPSLIAHPSIIFFLFLIFVFSPSFPFFPPSPLCSSLFLLVTRNTDSEDMASVFSSVGWLLGFNSRQTWKGGAPINSWHLILVW